MLDQPAEPGIVDSASREAKPPEETYYTPPGKAEPLNGRGKLPQVKRFNRKMLFVLAVVGAVVITLAFAMGLKPPKKSAAAAQSGSGPVPTPNESVNALPTSYADVPKLGEPKPGDVGIVSLPSRSAAKAAGGPAPALSPLEQYQSQLELDRLKREETARNSGVTFANATAAASASPASQGLGESLQDKILDLAQSRSSGSPQVSSSASASGTNTDGDQAMKTDFVDRSRGNDFTLHERVEALKSPYTLLAGAILPCVLTQGINSDLPGQIGCLISQNVYDSTTGRYLLIPQGTKAVGLYDSRVAYGQSRVLVVWTRLERPDGSTLSLEGMPGADLSGYAGLTGHVNNHYGRLLSGVILGSLIGASAQIATGANSQNPSFAALAAQGAGQNINEAGQQITRKNSNIQPTIEVPPGARLNIFATKDLILPPWKG